MANCLSAALAMEMPDGEQLLQTAWSSGWELGMQKATPLGFHPLSLCAAAHSSCADSRQSNQGSLLPPRLSGALRKVYMYSARASFHTPLAQMGWTSLFNSLSANRADQFIFPQLNSFPLQKCKFSKISFLLTFVMGNYWNTSFPAQRLAGSVSSGVK